jgi:hypothetical protein
MALSRWEYTRVSLTPHGRVKRAYFMDSQLTVLQLREGWIEELEVLTVKTVMRCRRCTELMKTTHIAICLGALGTFGALSVLACPARRVSLK